MTPALMTSALEATELSAPSHIKRKQRPRPTLGIIGGGQLARMTAHSAVSLGCDVWVLDEDADAPAAAVATQMVRGSARDPASLLQLAEHSDVITLENEFVDADLLAELEKRSHRVLPSSATMRVVQDKLLQKTALRDARLPVPAFVAVASQEEAIAAGRSLGWPLMLKRRRDGYDGKGNATLRGPDDVSAAWQRLAGEAHPLFAEAFCPFVSELAIMITLAPNGASAIYPLVHTVQHDHICRTVTAPALVHPEIARNAERIAQRAVQAVGGVGSFGIEMFLCADGSVLINELAPRVHNSGHYTIEACVCSQFENHVRAVMGWPLGSTAMRVPAAAMVNLLGHAPGPGAPRGTDRCLAVPGAHLHLYGKARSAAGRKMGHITALAATTSEAHEIAARAASALRFGDHA